MLTKPATLGGAWIYRDWDVPFPTEGDTLMAEDAGAMVTAVKVSRAKSHHQQLAFFVVKVGMLTDLCFL